MNVLVNFRTQLCVVFVLLFLASCANQTKIVTKQPVNETEKPSKEVVLNNAENALLRAELEWQKNGDINQRNHLLLAAAQDFQTGGECGRANIIVANIEPFLEDAIQQQYASLLKAECALIEHYASGLSAELITTPIDIMISWLTPVSANQFVDRKEVVIAHLAALHERWDLAVNVLSQQITADSPLNQMQEQILWQWFLKASAPAQKTLGKNNSFMHPYMTLANILKDENLTDVSRQQAILFWQKQHPTHPLSLNLPAGVQGYVGQNLKEVRRIAVLLPLSGRVEVQGDAIKQGIMAAYFARLEEINANNPGQVIPSITFLDTGSTNDSFVNSDITPEGLAEYDIVIGPLLREHVHLVKDFNLPESMMVYLNRIASQSGLSNQDFAGTDVIVDMLEEEFSADDFSGSDEVSPDSQASNIDAQQQSASSNDLLAATIDSGAADSLNSNVAQSASNEGLSNSAKVYFALAPEDEAIQLANLMKKRGVKTPIIISNGSSVSRRMITSFNQQWIALNGLDEIKPPKIVTFSDNKSLRIGITAALDVLQSQRRIRQMSNLTTETVHSVTRNRRDVDAFVVFAMPQQVELLNPIIEASISLFTERTIPVFATSYSYQHQLNNNSIRDLRSLVFVDMPFLMPAQRKSLLAKQVDSIWNNPPSSFLRLFAFGYDAFQFSEQMQQLAYFSHTELKGLSGTLSVNNERQVTRRLPSAVIQEDSITQLDGI